MNFEIKEIADENEKSGICERVLRALPDWFGNEDAIVNYIAEVKKTPLFAAYAPDGFAGFATVKEHNEYTAEVCVMGVLTGYHRNGIGTGLISRCEKFCAETGKDFLTVKTLDASREDAGYAGTRAFYFAAGFRPLETFPLFWDKDNPCLFLAKYLGHNKTKSTRELIK